MNTSIHTLRGSISVTNGLVSLTDIHKSAAKDQAEFHPKQWCMDHDVKWRGDESEVFASIEVARMYAFHVSPYVAGVLDTELKSAVQPQSAFARYSADRLAGSAVKSRGIFVKALHHAGIHNKEFAKLTDLIYQYALAASTHCLKQAYQINNNDSVRSRLDVKSLAKVITVEVNVTAAIYADELHGYEAISSKIKQQAELVSALYRDKTH